MSHSRRRAADRRLQARPVHQARPVQPSRPVQPPRPVSSGARARIALLIGLVLAGGGLVAALPAAADPPIQVANEITDSAGVLGAQTAQVQAALDQLADETEYQLFVVFVDSFDGADAIDWANETANRSSLGVDDLLLAVAVQDRAYAVSVDDALGFSDDQLGAVEQQQIEPQLRAEDWSGAAIAAAQGYREAADGGTGAPGGAGSSVGSGASGGSSFLTFLLVGVAVIVALLLVRSFRRRSAGSTPRGPDGRPVQGLAALATDELNLRAGQALVGLDDAIKTSEQELGFAQAQFGLQATQSFGQAISAGKATLGQAFTLRQQLDDSVPETDAQRRAMLLEILNLCDQVDTALDAQAEEFDRLRDLQARAPEVLAEIARRADEVTGRLPSAGVVLDHLSTTYSAQALTSVRGNVDQATALLDSARQSAVQGLEALEADRGTAVVMARTAEDAVAQAVTLLDAVDRAGADLAAAPGRIDAAVLSLTSDLADAEQLAPQDPAATAAADAARTVLTSAQQDRSAGDPLAVLRHLAGAEAALDAALGPARDAAEQADRARAALHGLLGRLGSQITAVGEFIETRRGAVGPEPRTRLAEAARLAQLAEQNAQSDPSTALGHAQQAEQLAVAAQQLAEADVARWQQSQDGGFGGGGGGGGVSSGSLILGGIILDQIFGGGGGYGGRSGGFGGGSFGGGSRGGRSSGGRSSGGRSGGGSFGGRSGGRSAGSFGGGGTRGRRGGGGRF